MIEVLRGISLQEKIVVDEGAHFEGYGETDRKTVLTTKHTKDTRDRNEYHGI